MGDGHALALDDVDAERRRIEEHVRQVVVEQVDLVDVEDPAVRLCQQARLERLLAGGQRPGDVDRAGDAILGGVQGQVDDPAASSHHRQLLTAPNPLRAAAHGSAGEQENGQSATTSISGRSSESPRTAVDFPVPLGPLISTPPIRGLTALSRSACVRRSCPTIAENGK